MIVGKQKIRRECYGSTYVLYVDEQRRRGLHFFSGVRDNVLLTYVSTTCTTGPWEVRKRQLKREMRLCFGGSHLESHKIRLRR